MNVKPNIPDWQHKENLKELADLRSKGYEIDVTTQGYFIKGVGGAATLNKPHGRYAEANLRDNTQSAIITARQAIAKANGECE